MRLYPKKLRSVGSLKQEKKKLLQERKELDKEDLFSFGSGGKKSAGNGKETSGFLLNMLPVSGTAAELLLSLIKRKFAKKEKKAEKNGGSGSKSMLFTIVKEFVGGYVKWKAIELSYKGIKRLIKKRREQRHTEQDAWEVQA